MLDYTLNEIRCVYVISSCCLPFVNFYFIIFNYTLLLVLATKNESGVMCALSTTVACALNIYTKSFERCRGILLAGYLLKVFYETLKKT
jgi:hypothetical protein